MASRSGQRFSSPDKDLAKLDEKRQSSEIIARLMTWATMSMCLVKREGERACRPDSVRRAEARRDDHSSGRPVARPLEPSTRMLGRAVLWRPEAPRMPIRCCSGWGLACRSCRHDRGELLPRRFTLAVGSRRTGRRLGGMLSVPLSVALGLSACCAWPLASTLPCGVRTFLQSRREAAASGRPARSLKRILRHRPTAQRRTPGSLTADGLSSM